MQLVIAEKPSVAKSIADVLGALDRQDGYFEGGGYLVSWCVGHLIELAEPESYAYIIPSGTEEYHYTKDGEEKSGAQFKFVMEFPNKKFTGKKK